MSVNSFGQLAFNFSIAYGPVFRNLKNLRGYFTTIIDSDTCG